MEICRVEIVDHFGVWILLRSRLGDNLLDWLAVQPICWWCKWCKWCWWFVY